MSAFDLNAYNGPQPSPKTSAAAAAERPKAKKVAPLTLPVGTEIGKFMSWDVGSGGVKYSDGRKDLRAFNCALNAALTFGGGVDQSHRGQGMSTFWNSTISTLPSVKIPYGVEDRGDTVKVGSRFVLPKVGSTVYARDLNTYLDSARPIPHGNYCGLGVKGRLLGVAAPMGPVCSSWTDFLYFYNVCKKENVLKYKFCIDASCGSKFNDVRDACPDMIKVDIYQDDPDEDAFPSVGKLNDDSTVELPPERYYIVFIASLDTSRLSHVRDGWIPFVDTLSSSHYFCGASGFYPISKVVDAPITTAHYRHFYNYMGLVSYFKSQCVATVHAECLAKALAQKEKRKGVGRIANVGLSMLGLSGPEEEEASDEFSSPPLKSAWNFVCKGIHDSAPFTKRKPERLEDAETQHGSKEAPLLFKHKKVAVISAFTSVMKWSDLNGKSGYAWSSKCLECKREWYINPRRLLDQSLFEPVKVVQEEESLEGETMEEGEFEPGPPEPEQMNEDEEVEGGGDDAEEEEEVEEDAANVLQRPVSSSSGSAPANEVDVTRTLFVSPVDYNKTSASLPVYESEFVPQGKVGTFKYAGATGPFRKASVRDGIYRGGDLTNPVMPTNVVNFVGKPSLTLTSGGKTVWWTKLHGVHTLVVEGVAVTFSVVEKVAKEYVVLNVGGVLFRVAHSAGICVLQMFVSSILGFRGQ